ncbi:hypothetical protein GCM10029964_120530 [Kibdelosporangium lantanae]
MLDTTDLSLTEAQPLPKQLLRDAVWAVHVFMERVQPICPTDQTHVLHGQRVAQLISCPERPGYHGWCDESVTDLSSATGAERAEVVCGKASPTSAVSLLVR